MNDDLLKYINATSKEHGVSNRLYGIRKQSESGDIYGQIIPQDEPIFWVSKNVLCPFHEKLIDRWISMGGEVT